MRASSDSDDTEYLFVVCEGLEFELELFHEGLSWLDADADILSSDWLGVATGAPAVVCLPWNLLWKQNNILAQKFSFDNIFTNFYKSVNL